MEDSFTTDFTVARFLLKPGRTYEEAVSSFSPYNSTKERNDAIRAAGRALINKAKKLGKRPSFIFVNNRLEGNAPITIEALLEEFEETEPWVQGGWQPDLMRGSGHVSSLHEPS